MKKKDTKITPKNKQTQGSKRPAHQNKVVVKTGIKAGCSDDDDDD